MLELSVHERHDRMPACELKQVLPINVTRREFPQPHRCTCACTAKDQRHVRVFSVHQIDISRKGAKKTQRRKGAPETGSHERLCVFASSLRLCVKFFLVATHSL